MKKILQLLGILLCIAVIFFVVTFAVYFFNLDMKLTAAIEPFMIKWYDKIDRDTHL